MTEKGINNNQVEVAGEIISTFEYSHEIFGEGFYMVKLLVNRLSEATDEIPLMISERLVDVTKDCRGNISGLSDSSGRITNMKKTITI